MAGQLDVSLVLKVIDQGFRGTISGARNELGRFARETESGFARKVLGATQTASKGIIGFAGGLKRTLTSTTAKLAGLAGTVGLAGAMKGVVGTITEFERLQGALETVTGGAEQGQEAFSKLQEFAAKTPFSLQQAVEGFIRLQSLGIEPTNELMTSFGNTSSAMGKSLIQFVEAVADASVGEFERLKEFGIKASSQGDQVALTFQGTRPRSASRPRRSLAT
jgi:phage tail tape-measure protein